MLHGRLIRRDGNYEILSEDFNYFPFRATWKRINLRVKRYFRLYHIRKLYNFVAKFILVEKYYRILLNDEVNRPKVSTIIMLLNTTYGKS